MPVNTYECMLILHPNQYARDPAAVSEQITTFVEKRNGKMLVSRLWDERKLAYPINGQRKGTYWLSYFELESAAVAQIERDCQLSNSILRTLILKVDSRIAETLVSHALGKAAEKPSGDVARKTLQEAAVASDSDDDKGEGDDDK